MYKNTQTESRETILIRTRHDFWTCHVIVQGSKYVFEFFYKYENVQCKKDPYQIKGKLEEISKHSM